MRIGLIAHHVAPIAEPYIGGVEHHTAVLAAGLAERGHDVVMWAPPGSQVPGVELRELPIELRVSGAARRDVSSMPQEFLAAHHAYLDACLALQRERLDCIHINTLHYMPVAMASAFRAPALLTLHCPPTPWLESALLAATEPPRLVAVSGSLAADWAHLEVPIGVIANGVDPRRWPMQSGAGGGCVWAGRIVPEKAPHLAVDAARRAGLPIQLAGPLIDRAYFDAELAPRLGPGARYVGHLDRPELAAFFGSAGVCLQTPVWDEPFGLVAAEAMMTGTPVAAFERGGLPLVIGPDGGVTARPGDVDALANAIRRAAMLDRSRVRASAHRWSVDRMLDGYEAAYEELARDAAAPLSVLTA